MASSLSLGGSAPLCAAPDSGQPWIRCEIHADKTNVVLRWLTTEGSPYQIESSSGFGAVWTNHGSACAGDGGWMSVAVPKENGSAGFFRVQDLSVAAASSGAVVAQFSPGSGILTITGTAADNDVIISRDLAGKILVARGTVAIKGGSPTVANTALISVFGLGGNDRLTLDEGNGALPKAQLSGGPGDDVLTGGSGDDLLLGQSGSDTLLGKGGADQLFGGTENDTVTGGDGNDSAFLESGDDRFIWNPGDDTDVVEGGDNTDVIEVNGGNAAEEFAVVANGVRVRFDRINPAPFTLDLGTCEELVLNANGGNDRFSATGNLAALIKVTVDGGSGNDTLLGSNGSDVLRGGDGDDLIDGQQGNDAAFLGAGNDVFQWDPGDGSDTIEGQDGFDILRFNGSASSEIFEASANGPRARLTRNVGNILMDFDGLEQIDVAASSGSDSITIKDLAGTDVTTINLDLSQFDLNGLGDQVPDTVTVSGSTTNDVVVVSGGSSAVQIVGLPVAVYLGSCEAAQDRLIFNLLGGDDVLEASALVGGVIKLTGNGGPGDDILIGSAGNDTLLGGDGDDVLLGGPGVDILDGGIGDDVVLPD